MSADSPVLMVVKRDKNSELIDDLLQEHGYSVRTASTPHESESMLRDVSDDAVVILDIDGYSSEFLGSIATSASSETPFVILYRADDIPPEIVSKLQTVEILEKPVKKQALLNKIQMVVESTNNSIHPS